MDRAWADGVHDLQLRWRYWLEIVLTVCFIEATIWTTGEVQRALFWCSAAWILFSGLRARRLFPLGIGLEGFRKSAWLLPATGVLALASIATADAWGSLHVPFASSKPLTHAVGYSVWAVFQQFILQSYLFLRLQNLVGSRRAVIASAALFSFVHAPNLVLMAATLIGGVILCEVFRRSRNIYVLGLAHAMIGLTLAVTMPDSIMHHMRVGLGYLTYHA